MDKLSCHVGKRIKLEALILAIQNYHLNAKGNSEALYNPSNLDFPQVV